MGDERGEAIAWWEVPLTMFRPSGESGAMSIQGMLGDGGV